MTHIRTIEEAEAILAHYIPLSSKTTGRDITLKRMRPLMDILGNPQRSLKVIHIAGTSGKTSTSYYIAALLTHAGYKTGLTVSPHMDSVRERLQINMKPVEEQEFCAALEELLATLVSESEPTYFELLVAMAYWYFAKVGVDYAVIETGLGGLEDGTNIADNPDKLCVITDIGYDHMHILGNSLSEIAAQKAGIIHPKNVALMYRQPDVIIGVFQDWCRKHGAELHFHAQPELEEGFPDPVTLAILPNFQKRNFLLAYEAYKSLKDRDGLRELSADNLRTAAETDIPGRMDKRTIESKTIIMDGAHNGQKMQAFVDSFTQQFPGEKAAVLLSLKEGKEHNDVLPLLKSITDTLIICGFSLMQDTPLHSAEPEKLAGAARKAGFKRIIVEESPDAAYTRLLAETKEIGIITGSFYLLGALRAGHKELRHA